MQEAPEVTLSDYWRILRKQRWIIAGVFLFVMIATFIFTKLQTPIFNSSIEIKIERAPGFQTGIVSEEALLAGSVGQTTNLATDLRLITSIPVVQQVVERLEVLPPDEKDREAALYNLTVNYQSKINAQQIEGTNIIKISVESNDARRAALTATALADVYIAKNMEERKKQARAAIEYIDREMQMTRTRLLDEENQLQKFNQNEKVFEVTADVKTILDRMTVQGTFEFENEMLKINQDLSKLNEAISTNSQFKKMEELFRVDNPDTYIFTGLKRRLLELEFERFLLLIDYTEQHPTVQKQDAVIADVKNKIVGMIKNFSKESVSPEVEADLALLIKRLFLESRQEVLYRIVNKFYGDTGSLSSNQLAYVRLKRNVENYLVKYDQLASQLEKIKFEEARIIDDVVTVVSPAFVPKRPIKPNAAMNYMISSVLGILLGILLCFLKESTDSSVSTIADVKEELQLSVLGIIPHIRKEDVVFEDDAEYASAKDKKTALQRRRLITFTAPKSWSAESYKILRTNLMRLQKNQGLKAILFTSSDKQEGKSTTVTNIAISMAQMGKRTVLVGCNMRRPTIYKIFGLERAPGLSDVLMGHITWQDAINSSLDILTGGLNVDEILSMPGIDNLKILTCGRPVENVSELLNSKAYDNLLNDLRRNFDIIIVDCSPVMAVPDAMTLADKVDGVVLIYKVGHTPKDVLKMAKSNLLNANANLLGVVLNNIKNEAQVGYSAYYYRYYGEKPEKEMKKGVSSIVDDQEFGS